MEVSVVNGGPEPVTVAQIMVDDANWVHTVNGQPHPGAPGAPHHHGFPIPGWKVSRTP